MAPWQDRILAADQGFDVSIAGDEAGSTSSFFYPQWKKKIPLEGQEGDYLTDRLTTLAVEYNYDYNERDLIRIVRITQENKERLLGAWYESFGG